MFNFADDMDKVFLDSGFEEDAIYTPSGASAIPIKAVLFRGSENTLNLNTKQGSSDVARKYKIEAYISRTYVPVVRVNADKIQFKKFPGDAADTIFNVAGIIYADAGAFRLGLV